MYFLDSDQATLQRLALDANRRDNRLVPFVLTEIQVNSYQGIIDHCNRMAQLQGVPCGLPVILPSSFLLGPRHMHQLYQYALTLVREFGRPLYLITFTCNPKWKEIQESLLPGQKYFDRPDIVCSFQPESKGLYG